jgi:hypothetical protein
MEGIERWVGHSPTSEPVDYAAILADLSSKVDVLNNIIQGVLIHADWLSAYGIDEAGHDLPPSDRSEPAATSRSCYAPFSAARVFHPG